MYTSVIYRHFTQVDLHRVFYLLLFPACMYVLFTTVAFSGQLETASPGAKENVNVESYKEAIRTAEQELAARDAQSSGPLGDWGISEVLGLLALICALLLVLWASRWVRGAGFGPKSGREMHILDRMAISRSSTLLLVRLRGRDYWLADHPGGVTLLGEAEPGEAPPLHGVKMQVKRSANAPVTPVTPVTPGIPGKGDPA